jgi:acyl-CoA thioesterase I
MLPRSGAASMLRFAAILALVVAALGPLRAGAETIGIVALGASNTAGKGVGTSAAWPARLETMLRAKGYDVRVTNAGISGDDTGRMLARVGSAVPNGTRLVILDKAASNDRRRGLTTDTNITGIMASLRARNIKAIVIEGMHGWAGRRLQADGIHITAEGHAAVAARLLPQVTAALGKP